MASLGTIFPAIFTAPRTPSALYTLSLILKATYANLFSPSCSVVCLGTHPEAGDSTFLSNT